jgi:hypothetical protein
MSVRGLKAGISDLYELGTPYEAELRAGLGELHWRFKCVATCRKCGKKTGQTWACKRVRWEEKKDPLTGETLYSPKGEPIGRAIPQVKPNEEQILTGIMILVHNNNVGRAASHARTCPVATMDKGKWQLGGVTARGK